MFSLIKAAFCGPDIVNAQICTRLPVVAGDSARYAFSSGDGCR